MASESDNLPFSESHVVNIIIFGESGVGKSAVINQVYDKTVVRSSNQAVGCTTDSAKVSGTIKDHPNVCFNLYDTVGLSESANGTVPAETAFVQLIKLAYAIPHGINLLVCCVEKGRLSGEHFKANYRIFKEELCENRIPCLLVITKCDGDDPINDWWVENEEIIRNQLKCNFIQGVCVSTIKTKKKRPEHILEDYLVSRRNLIEAMTRYALPEPILIDSWSRKVICAARSVYNSFTQWFSFLRLRQTSLRPEIEGMFIDLKYSPEQAREETNKLLRELAEGDLLAPYHEVNA